MAKAIVDRLEVVQIEIQDRGRAAPAAGPRQGVTETVVEQRSVRQPGEDVVERLVAELLLEGVPLGDVAVVDDHATDGRVVEQVLGDRLERAPCAISVAGPELDRHLRTARGRDVGQQPVHDRAVVRVNDVGRLQTDVVLGATTQDALDRRTLIPDQPIGTEDDHAIRGVLDERSEPLLAALQIDEQEPLGRRLLLESTVLTGEDARSATERQPDEQDQEARGNDRHDEHDGPGGVDPLLGEACVLVDVIDADRIAVDGAADRDEHVEIAVRQWWQAVDPDRAELLGGRRVADIAEPRRRRRRRRQAGVRWRSAGREARAGSNTRSGRRATRC